MGKVYIMEPIGRDRFLVLEGLTIEKKPGGLLCFEEDVALATANGDYLSQQLATYNVDQDVVGHIIDLAHLEASREN